MTNILPWLSLKNTKGIGNLLFKRLFDKFGSPELVFQASLDELRLIEGINQKNSLEIKKQQVPDFCKKEVELANKQNINIITMADDNYPSLLLQLHDPPPYLYVYGKLDLKTPRLSIVGSRNATSYGLSATHKLCMDLSKAGFQIVSGMARGIDTAAHKATILTGGKTIAVLGSGLNMIYPPENKALFHKISENGAVISEFNLTAKPEPHHFPLRNRIISGLSLGTIVIEAAQRSGSLITARLAAEQGREVFAVPGSIQSKRSTGTHALLKQGAKLVESVQDITEELGHFFMPLKQTDNKEQIKKPSVIKNLNSEELLVYQALEPYPIHIDKLSRKLSLESGKLSSILLQLELLEIITQSPGKLFSLAYHDE